MVGGATVLGQGRGRAGSVGFCEGRPIHVLSSWPRCPVPSGRETLCLTGVHLIHKYRAISVPGAGDAAKALPRGADSRERAGDNSVC